MVRIEIDYQGELRCAATHIPSGARLLTDAPVDNQGKGASYSPTDLVATALGTCMATIMAITAQRHGLDLKGTSVSVDKLMVADPLRRIGKLETLIHVPLALDDKTRKLLEAAAAACPVHKSLHEDIEKPVTFQWG
jgi:putative redox protein